MDFIIMIIVGGIAGWLASMVMNRDASMGIFWNIVVGIIGGLIGGWLLGQFISFSPEWLSYLVTATIGAVVLLAIVNLIQRGRVR
nr:GlsB/YeaQ/YmgE family stress response membrane protein [Aurantiacibacter gangjinensis]